jgi:rsbT co-antagonist protein RsbR
LIAHLRQHGTQLREEWLRCITEAQLLTTMSKDEIFAEATSIYDSYVDMLETGSVEALQYQRIRSLAGRQLSPLSPLSH